MQRLPDTKISDFECDYLLTRRVFDFGGEAVICKSPRNTLYKIFVYPGSDIASEMSDNKYRKILQVYLKNLKHSIRPLSTLSANGRLIGYEMSHDLEDLTLLDTRPRRRALLQNLMQVREALSYFSQQGIIYGDVKNDNILVNKKTKQIKFCDIDNASIDDYPIDVMAFELEEYVRERGTLDRTADAFMHNLLTIQQLTSSPESQQEIYHRLQNDLFPAKFPKETYPIMESMCDPKNFSGEFIIDYIKR